MSDTLGKWSIRFYKPRTALPCETHDGGNKWESAGDLALMLAREPAREGLICEVLTTLPTRKERDDYQRGHVYLRWRLNLKGPPPDFIPEFVGVDASFPKC